MNRYRFGDVVLVDFPYSDRESSKRRPGLVLAQDTYGDLLVARISSAQATFATDVPIINWRESGLNIPSILRLLKIATSHEDYVLKTLGKLTPTDRRSVVQALERFVKSLDS